MIEFSGLSNRLVQASFVSTRLFASNLVSSTGFYVVNYFLCTVSFLTNIPLINLTLIVLNLFSSPRRLFSIRRFVRALSTALVEFLLGYKALCMLLMFVGMVYIRFLGFSLSISLRLFLLLAVSFFYMKSESMEAEVFIFHRPTFSKSP